MYFSTCQLQKGLGIILSASVCQSFSFHKNFGRYLFLQSIWQCQLAFKRSLKKEKKRRFNDR